MKKYPSGFVPVDFQSVGKILLVIGTICVLSKAIDLFVGIFSVPKIVLYFGVFSFVLALYLIFIVPEND